MYTMHQHLQLAIVTRLARTQLWQVAFGLSWLLTSQKSPALGDDCAKDKGERYNWKRCLVQPKKNKLNCTHDNIPAPISSEGVGTHQGIFSWLSVSGGDALYTCRFSCPVCRQLKEECNLLYSYVLLPIARSLLC